MNADDTIRTLNKFVEDGADAIFLPIEGEMASIFPANATTFTLEEVVALVGDEYHHTIERVRLPFDDWILLVNEEGKFGDVVDVNYPATLLAKDVLKPGDFIAGSAVLCRDSMFG
jgi:hypothetical protein